MPMSHWRFGESSVSTRKVPTVGGDKNKKKERKRADRSLKREGRRRHGMWNINLQGLLGVILTATAVVVGSLAAIGIIIAVASVPRSSTAPPPAPRPLPLDGTTIPGEVTGKKGSASLAIVESPRTGIAFTSEDSWQSKSEFASFFKILPSGRVHLQVSRVGTPPYSTVLLREPTQPKSSFLVSGLVVMENQRENANGDCSLAIVFRNSESLLVDPPDRDEALQTLFIMANSRHNSHRYTSDLARSQQEQAEVRVPQAIAHRNKKPFRFELSATRDGDVYLCTLKVGSTLVPVETWVVDEGAFNKFLYIGFRFYHEGWVEVLDFDVKVDGKSIAQ